MSTHRCLRGTFLAPWRPRVAGRVGFFFGPVAGALIVAISLRRMGYEKVAKKVMLLALCAAVAEAAILLVVPEFLTRPVGLGSHVVFLLIFPVLIEQKFSEWQALHPNTIPSSGWNAVGWSLLGAILFFAIFALVFVGLSGLFPE
jgi:hypothetical protein